MTLYLSGSVSGGLGGSIEPLNFENGIIELLNFKHQLFSSSFSGGSGGSIEPLNSNS